MFDKAYQSLVNNIVVADIKVTENGHFRFGPVFFHRDIVKPDSYFPDYGLQVSLQLGKLLVDMPYRLLIALLDYSKELLYILKLPGYIRPGLPRGL